MIRIILTLLCLAGSTLAEPLVLRFAPPDSVSSVTSLVGVRYRELGDQRGPTDTSVVISRESLVRTPDGYRYHTATEDMYTSRNGEVKPTGMDSAFMATDFVMDIDSAGMAIEFHGFDQLDSYLQAHTDSSLYQIYKNSLDFDALRAKELAIWNGRMERLTSSPLQPGEMYLEEVDVALPNVGEMAIYAVTHFVDTLRVDGTLLGKMLVIQNTNLDSLSARLGLTPEEMVAEFDLSDSLFAGNRANVANANGGLAVAAAMVFEVKTLLLVSELTETVVSMKVLDNDGVTRVGRMYESKTKTVEYLK